MKVIWPKNFFFSSLISKSLKQIEQSVMEHWDQRSCYIVLRVDSLKDVLIYRGARLGFFL